jgi:hypothetical protein
MYCVCRTAIDASKVHSLVGLIPLFATAIFSGEVLEKLPTFRERAGYFARHKTDLMTQINHPLEKGVGGRHLFAPFNAKKLRRILQRMLDESEFLSPCGIRALSRYHAEHPYVFSIKGGSLSCRLRTGGIFHRALRRKFELARPDLDAGQCTLGPIAEKALLLLW